MQREALNVSPSLLAGCSNDEEFVPTDNLKDTPITIRSAGVTESVSARAISDNLLTGNGVTLGLYVADDSYSDDRYTADHEQYVAQNDPNAVTIHTTVGTMPQTRVTYEDDGSTAFGESDQIRVINRTRSGKNKSDAVYAYNGGEWTPDDADNYVVWEGIGTNDFYGIYPSTATYTEFSLPTDQQDGVHIADWMTATYSGEKGEYGIVDFHMRHMLSKVTVNMEFATQYEGNPKISDVKFPVGATKLQATYQNDGRVDINSTASSADDLPYKNDNTIYTAILPPFLYTSITPFITLKIGEENLIAYPKNNHILTGAKLQSGKHYTFTLKVGKDKVSIDKVSVEDWVTEEIDGGIAEESDEVTTEEQFTAALSAGGKISLGSAVSITGVAEIRNAVDLDLNGYTLTLGNSYGLYVQSGASLNVKNGTVINNCADGGQAVYNNGGTVFIEGCTLTSDMNTFYHVSGASTLKDCTLNGLCVLDGNGTVALQGDNFTFGSGDYLGIIVISEGKVLCTFDPTNYLFDNYGQITYNVITNDNVIWTVTASGN